MKSCVGGRVESGRVDPSNQSKFGNTVTVSPKLSVYEVGGEILIPHLQIAVDLSVLPGGGLGLTSFNRKKSNDWQRLLHVETMVSMSVVLDNSYVTKFKIASYYLLPLSMKFFEVISDTFLF